MKIVLIAHPDFLNSRSMPIFSEMLAARFSALATLKPKPVFSKINLGGKFQKWLGYIDQYIIFPIVLRKKINEFKPDILFVFCDQALGPWVPCLKDRPHVIHCHDLMALRSSLGEIRENPTGLTGRIYQKFIRWGFSSGKNFISVSEKTREDLHRLAPIRADRSVVVHNGLNYPYKPMQLDQRISILKNSGLPVSVRGMLLHVGGSQWYKNRAGVIELYAEYARSTIDPLPLWMVGPKNQTAVLDAIAKVPSPGEVHLLSGLDAETLHAVYAHAALFLFPSLDEGFGWPIAEAQACGTLVLTTNAAPMTEVGGDAAFYLERRTPDTAASWAQDGAAMIRNILALDADARAAVVSKGLINAARFDPEKTIAGYAAIYEQIINEFSEKS